MRMVKPTLNRGLPARRGSSREDSDLGRLQKRQITLAQPDRRHAGRKADLRCDHARPGRRTSGVSGGTGRTRGAGGSKISALAAWTASSAALRPATCCGQRDGPFGEERSPGGRMDPGAGGRVLSQLAFGRVCADRPGLGRRLFRRAGLTGDGKLPPRARRDRTRPLPRGATGWWKGSSGASCTRGKSALPGCLKAASGLWDSAGAVRRWG